MASTNFYCKNCGKELKPNQLPCPFCGCDKRHVHVHISERLEIRESLKVRGKRPGFKKFAREIIQGWFPSRNPKLANGVDKTRIIDKEKDEYHETIIDKKTGDVVRDVHEPLSQHKPPAPEDESRETVSEHLMAIQAELSQIHKAVKDIEEEFRKQKLETKRNAYAPFYATLGVTLVTVALSMINYSSQQEIPSGSNIAGWLLLVCAGWCFIMQGLFDYMPPPEISRRIRQRIAFLRGCSEKLKLSMVSSYYFATAGIMFSIAAIVFIF